MPDVLRAGCDRCQLRLRPQYVTNKLPYTVQVILKRHNKRAASDRHHQADAGFLVLQDDIEGVYDPYAAQREGHTTELACAD